MIVTSYLFPEGKFALDRLEDLEKKVGKEKLIVDISCRRREDGWVVAMNGWKTLTDMWVTQGMSFPVPIIYPLPIIPKPFYERIHPPSSQIETTYRRLDDFYNRK